MAEQTEAGIRDFLATHLSWFEEGLELVGTEVYLADQTGARGRIDILARDTDRCYVIIEVKRSNKVARETFVEIFKYTHLLRQLHGVQPSELRIILASTVWDELREPFAEFRNFVDYATEGYLVILGDDNLPASIRLIPTVEAPLTRSLSPEQVNFLFTTEQRRDAAAQQLARKLRRIGVTDFLIAMQQLKDHEQQDEIRVPFCACAAMQRHPAPHYVKILQRHGDLDEDETLEYFERQYDDEDELLRSLEDDVWALVTPGIDCDDLEVGYPEKFHAHVDIWPVTRIERFGLFAHDKRLGDGQIIEELCGFPGINQFTFVGSASSRNQLRVSELRHDVVESLKFNTVWAAHVDHALTSLESMKRDYRVYVDVFCPEDILQALRLLAPNPQTTSAPVPGYYVLIDFGNEALMYTGTLLWDGVCRSFDALLTQFFHGDYLDYWRRHVHFGPDVTLERRIQSFLGVRYASNFQEIGQNGTVVREDIVIENGQIKARQSSKWHPIRNLITGCPDFIANLIKEDARWVMRM